MQKNESILNDADDVKTSVNSHPSSNKQKENPDKRLTLEEEADLTPQEIEQMEKEVSEKDYKGSSGPEEKDISA